MSLRSLLLVLGLSSLVAVGCGGGGEVEKLVPVGGTLLIDGKPLDGVVVTFTPAEVKKNSRGGSGTTDATGAFIVTHIDQNLPGLSPGKYSLSYSRMRLPNGSAAPKLKAGEQPDPANIQIETLPPQLTSPNPNALANQVEIPLDGNNKMELKVNKQASVGGPS